jgi:chromosome partitioning protein
MAITIAFVSSKGGVGKSTCAVNVAAELVARGHKTLLVDLDEQGTARVWGDIAHEQGHGAPVVVGMGPTVHKQLPAILPQYDFAILDTPGRSDVTVRAALLAADLAVMPCSGTPADVWGLAPTLKLVAEAQALGSLRACILVNRKKNAAIGRNARQVLAKSGVPILSAELGDRVAYAEALATGKAVSAYAPADAAAREMTTLLAELVAFAKGEEHAVQACDRVS